MKRLYSIILVSLIPLSVISQEKLIFSDSFKVNTNNWALVNKKNLKVAMGKEISADGAYMIENMTKDIFTTFVPELPTPEKDFRITTRLDKGFIEPGFKKDPNQSDEGFGIVFGAKDENTFFIFQIFGKGIFQMSEYENGKQKSVLNSGYSKLMDNNYGIRIEIISENDRWKVFAGIQKEIILNVPASPLLGNKIGFRAGSIEDWFIKYLTVYEVEKKSTSVISKLVASVNSFPTPAFHTVFPDILCDMFNRFRDIMDKPLGRDSTWYSTKRIPGFGPVTIQHLKDFSDAGCVAKFKKMDDALIYFEEAAAAIAPTPGACFTLKKYYPDYQLNKKLQGELKKYEHWTTEIFRDPETGIVFRSIIELSIPNSLGDYGNVELHVFLLHEKK
jgi:hypothetical protein